MEDRLRVAAGASFAPELALRSLGYLEESSPQARAEIRRCKEKFLIALSDLVLVSPPMLDLVTRHPEWMSWLQDTFLHHASGSDQPAVSYEHAWLRWCDQSEQVADELDTLRTFRSREYLLLSCLDVAGVISFEETIRRLSMLADFVINRALEHCWRQLADYKPAEVALGSRPTGFCIFAMGKLGGLELNYSSDVDLLFFARVSETDVAHRFFTRLGECLVRSLSQPGMEGSLYRVDMRLRPYGETGPLVPSLTSLVNYYESWAEAWERQALIKARFVAGDGSLGRRFADFVADFTFARQMDDSSLEEIKRVKHRSEKEHAMEGGRIHLKQGPGGIRDIEFYVQFLQLIGGMRPGVRTGSTLEAIRGLGEARLLLDGEESELSLAYKFLRIVEHRLQMKALTPQAVLPDDREELAFLARGLGFDGDADEPARKLEGTLRLYRCRVRAILERIYLQPGYLHMKDRAEELAQLLSDRAPRQRIRELLAPYGFQDVDKAWHNIRLMALGPAGRMLPPGERRAFLEFAFVLLEVLRDSLDPDRALHNLESLAAASGNRISFLRALASRRSHLERFANLLAHSNLCQQILNRHPEYFDSLVRGLHLRESRNPNEMLEEMESRLERANAFEAEDNLLRKFRQREMIRIAYRDLAGMGDAVEISRELSHLAETCVRAASRLAPARVPVLDLVLKEGLYAIALGKFGSGQLHYSSDLDLIFIYDDPGNETSAEVRAQIQRGQDARVEKILTLLAGITSEGAAYYVDLRLRPEGGSGLLARSWQGFMDYAREFMQPWERMALVRSRLINSDPATSLRWNSILTEIVYEHSWNDDAIGSIRHLKRRIETEKNRESRTHLDFKYGRGGIVDLEFLVQFLQLRFGREHPCVRASFTPSAIAALASVGAISHEESSELLAAHRFQRHVENHYQLMEEWVSREISRESEQLVRLGRSLGVPRGAPGVVRRQFLDLWEESSRTVRRLVEKYFYETHSAKQ